MHVINFTFEFTGIHLNGIDIYAGYTLGTVKLTIHIDEMKQVRLCDRPLYFEL